MMMEIINFMFNVRNIRQKQKNIKYKTNGKQTENKKKGII